MSQILTFLLSLVLSFNSPSPVWQYQTIGPVPGARLNLIPNYSQKLDSQTLMSRHGCQAGINGGFYTSAGRPIGQLTASGKQISPWQENPLFNGLVQPNPENAVQSGPVLLKNNRKHTVRGEQEARRMVAIKLVPPSWAFLAIYNQDSRLDGPKLSQLPAIVEKIAYEKNWKISEAVNLDGGSASAFDNGTIKLLEWQPVGSWWCVQK